MRRGSRVTDSGGAMASLAFTLAALGTAFAAAPPLAPPPISPAGSALASAVTATDGSFPVTLTLTTRLAGLRPEVANGTWSCSARAMTRRAIDAEIAKISALTASAAHDEFHAGLEYRAQYLGQQAAAPFVVTGGAYAGTTTVTIKVGADDLIDPATKRVVEDPGVLVGCWLLLSTAAGLGGYAVQAPPAPASAGPAETVRHVAVRPFVLVSAAVAGA